jgi:hypothetical protein
MNVVVRLLGCSVRCALAAAHAPVVEQALARRRSFKQWLNTCQQRNGGYVCDAIGCDDHDGVTLFEIGNLDGRRAAEHLLRIAASCTAAGSLRPLAAALGTALTTALPANLTSALTAALAGTLATGPGALRSTVAAAAFEACGEEGRYSIRKLAHLRVGRDVNGHLLLGLQIFYDQR